MTNSPSARSPLRLRGRLLLAASALLILAVMIRLRGGREEGWSFFGATMGTSYTVRIVEPSSGPLTEAMLQDTIQQVLDRVDGSMSTYDPDSELSRFNRHGDSMPLPASPALLEVMATALEVGRQSGGALDVTVGSLVRAWGFGPDLPTPDRATGPPPWQSALDQVLVDTEQGTIRKLTADVEVDLSAVAKGFGVDEVARALERNGVADYLVEVGGEIRLSGLRPGGGLWRVGVEAPDPDTRGLARTVSLTDIAVATSGDYRNTRVVDGELRSHFIDPRTGAPVPYRGISVTVLHQEAMTADAWSTAMSVLGPIEGLALAEQEGLAVLFLQEEDGELVPRQSSGFSVLAGTGEEDGR